MIELSSSKRGLEIDLIAEVAGQLNLMEIKAGATVNSHFFKKLKQCAEHYEGVDTKGWGWLVYGGNDSYTRQGCRVTAWNAVSDDFVGL